MIDIRKLKELVKLMVGNELTELDLRDNEEQVTLRRQSPPAATAAMAAPAMTAAPVPQVAAVAEPAPTVTIGEGDEGLTTIASPMVGTFYATPNPEAAPFARVGTSVDPEMTVCIIEAMKIFNEIKAECSGVIQKVLVRNGDAVEYGQPMFLVKPG